MAVEYLGHKRHLLPFILNAIEEKAPRARTFGDVFCGTGTVSAALKGRGQRVTAVDNLVWCTTFTAFKLLNREPPSFSGIGSEIPEQLGYTPYRCFLTYLNSL